MFIVTDMGNKVSKQAHIYGSQNIVLKGKSVILENAVLRGDLRRVGAGSAVSIATGVHVLIDRNVVLRPPYKTYKGQFSYYPLRIGDHVWIKQDSIIEAATIGSFVLIGQNCMVGRFAMISDCCLIENNTIIPTNTVIPPLSVGFLM